MKVNSIKSVCISENSKAKPSVPFRACVSEGLISCMFKQELEPKLRTKKKVYNFAIGDEGSTSKKCLG